MMKALIALVRRLMRGQAASSTALDVMATQAGGRYHPALVARDQVLRAHWREADRALECRWYLEQKEAVARLVA